jgi:hypothetical protein
MFLPWKYIRAVRWEWPVNADVYNRIRKISVLALLTNIFKTIGLQGEPFKTQPN